MPKWQLGTKLFTGSVVSLLLSVGLCGAGFTLEGSGGGCEGFRIQGRATVSGRRRAVVRGRDYCVDCGAAEGWSMRPRRFGMRQVLRSS